MHVGDNFTTVRQKRRIISLSNWHAFHPVGNDAVQKFRPVFACQPKPPAMRKTGDSDVLSCRVVLGNCTGEVRG